MKLITWFVKDVHINKTINYKILTENLKYEKNEYFYCYNVFDSNRSKHLL